MATYTFTTNVVQELALTELRQSSAHGSNQDYVAARVSDLLAPAVAEYLGRRAQRVLAAYSDPSTTIQQRLAAEEALGL